MQKLSSVMRSHLSIVGLNSQANGVLFRKSSLCAFFGVLVTMLVESHSGCKTGQPQWKAYRCEDWGGPSRLGSHGLAQQAVLEHGISESQ